MPYAAARDIIAKDAGQHFDPAVVEAFLEVPPEEWDQIRESVMADVKVRRENHQAAVRRGHTALLNPAVEEPV
jgi:response regulator RpfG family c-di-GMP phosphodiesterase